MRRPVIEPDVSLFIHQALLHLQQRVLWIEKYKSQINWAIFDNFI